MGELYKTLSKERYLQEVVKYMKDNDDEVFNNIYDNLIQDLLNTIQIKNEEIDQLKDRIITFTES